MPLFHTIADPDLIPSNDNHSNNNTTRLPPIGHAPLPPTAQSIAWESRPPWPVHKLDVPVWPCAIRLRSPLGGGVGGERRPPPVPSRPSVSSYLPRLRLIASSSSPSRRIVFVALRLIASSSSPSHRIFLVSVSSHLPRLRLINNNNTTRLPPIGHAPLPPTAQSIAWESRTPPRGGRFTN